MTPPSRHPEGGQVGRLISSGPQAAGEVEHSPACPSGRPVLSSSVCSHDKREPCEGSDETASWFSGEDAEPQRGQDPIQARSPVVDGALSLWPEPPKVHTE